MGVGLLICGYLFFLGDLNGLVFVFGLYFFGVVPWLFWRCFVCQWFDCCFVVTIVCFGCVWIWFDLLDLCGWLLDLLAVVLGALLIDGWIRWFGGEFVFGFDFSVGCFVVGLGLCCSTWVLVGSIFVCVFAYWF